MKNFILTLCILGIGKIALAQTYLPLTGGNLTGALTGTSATFSGPVYSLGNSLYFGPHSFDGGYSSAISTGTHSYAGRLSFQVKTWGVGTDYGLTEVAYIDMDHADDKVPKIILGKYGGNVGIGTTNPASILHVYRPTSGDNLVVTEVASAASNWTGLSMRYAGNEYFSAKGNVNSGEFRLGGMHSSGYYATIYSNGAETMRVAGGNVGIGTTDPGSYKLAVNGHVRAKEIKVETGWSDFVFEPDYKLLSLKETEEYIKKNGHLPEIPSAKEVEANGINLGEMNAKLLQKIEELTLHLIEQNKDLNKLRSEMTQLKLNR